MCATKVVIEHTMVINRGWSYTPCSCQCVQDIIHCTVSISLRGNHVVSCYAILACVNELQVYGQLLSMPWVIHVAEQD